MRRNISYQLHGIAIEACIPNERLRSYLDDFWQLDFLDPKSQVFDKLTLKLIETTSLKGVCQPIRGRFFLPQFGFIVRSYKRGFVLRHWPRADAIFYWSPPEKKLSGWLHPKVFESKEKFLYTILMPALRIALEFYGLFSVHAGAVSKGQRAILLLAEGGGGKSTTTFALVRRGFKFLADDRPFVRENGSGVEILSVPERIGLRQPTVKLFPELRSLCPLTNEHLGKMLIDLPKLLPNCFGSSARPSLIVLLNRKKTRGIRVERLPKLEVLSKIIREEFFVLPNQSGKTSQQLRLWEKLVNTSESYRLTYPVHRMDQVVNAIERLHAQTCLPQAS